MTAIRNNLLQDIPGDVQLVIVDYLSIADLLRLGTVSSYFFRRFLGSDPLGIWKQRYQRDISEYILKDLLKLPGDNIPHNCSLQKFSDDLHNQLPSGDNQLPSGDNQLPSGDNQLPSGDNQLPSGDNQMINTEYTHIESPVIKIVDVPSYYLSNYRFAYRNVITSLQNITPSNRDLTDPAEIATSLYRDKILFIVSNGYEKLLIKASHSPFDQQLLDMILTRTVSHSSRMDLFELSIAFGANDFSQSLDMAIRVGNIPAIDRSFELGLTHHSLNDGFMFFTHVMSAIRTGNLYITNHLLALYQRIISKPLGRGDLNLFLGMAAQCGHLDIVNLCINLGATGFNRALVLAAQYGSLNVIDRLVECGADNFNEPLRIATLSGEISCYLPFINRMVALGATDFNTAMINAIYSGTQNVVERMIELGANNIEEGLQAAACQDWEWMIEYMIKLGAHDFNSALLAIIDDDPPGEANLRRFIAYGANDFDGGLIHATIQRNLEVVKFFIELGATAIQPAYEISLASPDFEVHKYLKSLL